MRRGEVGHARLSCAFVIWVLFGGIGEMLFGFAWAWPLKFLFKATLCFPRFGHSSNE